MNNVLNGTVFLKDQADVIQVFVCRNILHKQLRERRREKVREGGREGGRGGKEII